ncbi:hypothetical protein [Nocardioides sp. HB32]
MTRSRPVAATCSHCGRRYPAKRLTRAGAAGCLCQKCFDRLPTGLRHTLLRKAGQ